MQKSLPPRYHIHSLDRGLRILELLARIREPLTLSRIAALMGLTLPTAYRFLFTLESLGYVEKDPEAKSYCLSPKVLALGYGAFQSSDLWQTAHPYLLRASREHGETFNLAILDGTDILYIDRVKTQKILTINLEIGSKLPAYCTSMGRALLAFLPREQAFKIIEQSEKKAMTPRTVLSTKALKGVLERVRKAGYAVNDGELALELISVAAPVRNRDGKVVAALNMAVNAAQYEKDAIHRKLAPVVKATALKISQALGFYEAVGHG
ncbi:MAG: helix-turn-helix domain-containing protein [Deltaproteobacteria bacterium]|nr:helix-turn-helix domain-containing protein [Deltaproteobacteria bacterium]